MFGLARRQTVCRLFYVAWPPGGMDGSFMFQNNNKLMLGLARRQTVCRLLFTSPDRLGQGREGKVMFVYVRRPAQTGTLTTH